MIKIYSLLFFNILLSNHNFIVTLLSHFRNKLFVVEGSITK